MMRYDQFAGVEIAVKMRYYRFAGVEIAVEMPDEWFYLDEHRLAPFLVEETTNPDVFRFEKMEALDEPQGAYLAQYPGFAVFQMEERFIRYIGSTDSSLQSAYIRVESCGKEHQVQLLAERFPERVGTKSVLNSIGAEYLVVQADGVILHCSYIVWQGRAILFTAPSETGKSTQAALWEKYRRAEIINGDRAAVRYDQGVFLACGIPFAGSSSYCGNKTLPIAAIVYLEKAPKTAIRRLGGIEAFRRIWEGCSVPLWEAASVGKVCGLVEHLIQNVPVYHLACTPDESAVIILEKELGKEE